MLFSREPLSDCPALNILIQATAMAFDLLHDIDGFAGGMVGTFQSALGSTATIVFDSTKHEHSLSQYDIALTFEPLDLVEVVLGRHKGLRGMVVMTEEHEVSVVDENDSSNLVRK